MEKRLGKIAKVRFGFCGYQEAMFGLAITLEGSAWGCCTDITGGWSETVQPSSHAQWTEADRKDSRAEMCKKVDKLLRDAKVEDIAQLPGKPIEAEFDGMMLKGWRILTEVL